MIIKDPYTLPSVGFDCLVNEELRRIVLVSVVVPSVSLTDPLVISWPLVDVKLVPTVQALPLVDDFLVARKLLADEAIVTVEVVTVS